ncbi:DNA polymerase I [Macrococcus hajekii]|uniref:DNA polymerase I n=1 Tax=Macrococcus hajekii TaxID=198482 RepID=A0A4R6BLN5_9STAP|nr:DNA polymerase I [Macrococcus hajekii]TDM02713.1 DNA polymerase I [Macrococcus hajekii]GGB03283.1 DNA polymerase I [Macrococcus hajekii]
MSEKLILIDGNSLAFRAFYALPLLNNRSGIHTNAVYGFTLLLDKIIKDESPTHFLVAFDAGKTTFRHSTFSEYKGGRQKTPPELSEQFPLIRKLVEAYHIKHYELENYEADDIIGTLAKEAADKKMETIIITGDRDLTQLVNDYVSVYYTKKGVTDIDHYTPEFVQDKYGFGPDKIIDLKGLMGDKSDNIPGVPGVGEKTAIKLLLEYGTVEEVISHLSDIKAKKLNENLMNHQADALMSKQLATIEVNAPIEMSLEDIKLESGSDEDKIKLFKELEFKQMLEQMNTAPVVEQQDMKIVDIKNINLEGTTAIFIDCFKDNYLVNEVLPLAITDGSQTAVISSEELTKNQDLKNYLEDATKNKYVFDAKKTVILARRSSIEIRGIDFDVMLASYLLDPSKTIVDVAETAKLHSITIPNNEQIFGKGAKMAIPEAAELNEYFARQAMTIYQLTAQMKSALENNEQMKLHDELELPLSLVLADMEYRGIKVDKQALIDMQEELKTRIDELVATIYQLAGHEFNINSPKQLGVILFEELGLPAAKKTKTGYSTAVDVLEGLRDQHEIIAAILDYRQLAKLQSTYVEGLQKMIAEDDKIHTRFNQVLAQTGRLSSVEPNLQNIPIRLEEGRKIRKAFTASKPGWVIFAADYSQIELRVLAHITEDKSMMDAFNHGIDIHTKTAMEVFDVEKDEVNADMRRQAKAVNFGIVYGISDYGLSQSLGISRPAAAKFIEDYLESFPNVKQYMDDIIQQAKQDGYVSTLLNRRRYIPDITARNYNVRGFAERTAMNTPIQGSAADIIKLAMVNYAQEVKGTDFNAELLLQVHDELIFEVPEDEIEAFSLFVKNVMENALELSVPLLVESSYGASWYEAK